MRRYLVDLRKKLKLSQQDVADKIEISRQYYNAIENGNRQKKMDTTLIAKLSVALSVSITELFVLEEQWTKQNQRGERDAKM